MKKQFLTLSLSISTKAIFFVLLFTATSVAAHPDPDPISPAVALCLSRAREKHQEVSFDLEKQLIKICEEKIASTPAREVDTKEVRLLNENPPVIGINTNGAAGTANSVSATQKWQTLFSDDFSGQLAYSWDLFGSWSVPTDTTDKMLEIGGTENFNTYAGSESWTDYNLSFKYKPLRKNEEVPLKINFRVDWSKRRYYSVLLSPTQNLVFLQKTDDYIPTILVRKKFILAEQEWHDISITALGDKIWLTINGEQLIAVRDLNNPLLFGRIGLEAKSSSTPIARIDDVKIFGVYEMPVWDHLDAPFGGKVAKIIIDSRNSNNILLTAEHAAVYKSTDGGNNWQAAFKGLNTVDLIVKGFAMSPHDSNIILTSASDGPYRTTDQARTWRKVSKIITPKDVSISGKAFFVFSLSDPNRVYMGTDKDIEDDGVTRGGVFLKSNDAGASFNAYSNKVFNKNVNVLSAHPNNADVVFVGTKHEGLYKTSDGGLTWSAQNEGLNYYSVTSIAFNPANSEQMFITAGLALSENRFVFRSDNGGRNWQKVKIILDNSEFNGAKVVKFAPSAATANARAAGNVSIYVLGNNLLAVSRDGGNSWSKINITGAYGAEDIAIDPHNSNKLLVGYYNGVMVSNNGGKSWNRNVQGMGAYGIISLAIDPKNSAIVYAGDWSYGGIHKSTDYGRTWESVNNGLAGDKTLSDKASEGQMFPNVHNIVVDPNNSNILYASLYDSGIFKTTDSGKKWQAINNGLAGLNVSQVIIFPGDPIGSGSSVSGNSGSNGGAGASNILYAAATKRVNYFEPTGQKNALFGVYKSVDAGNTWMRVSRGLTDTQIQSLAVHPTDANIVYAGSALDGIFKSTDGGKTWRAKNNGFAPEDDYIQSIAINPSNPNELYAGIDQIYKSRLMAGGKVKFVSNGGAIYKSTDAGESWQKLNLDTVIASVEKIVIDPANPRNVYVSTHSPGVYKSSDAGATWKPINIGMLYLDETYGGHNYVFALDISKDGQILYAGGCGRGVFRTQLPASAEIKKKTTAPSKLLTYIIALSASTFIIGGVLIYLRYFKKRGY